MALKRLVLAADKVDKISSNETVNKFIQEQLNTLLHSPKLRELVERVSLQEEVSKDKALKSILEKMADETEQASKKRIAAFHVVE
jgi:tripartite-type tricarboxylate transporter receptor subunit TctC